MSLESFRNDGLTFDVSDAGSGPETVILLHGFPQTNRSWRLITPALVEAGYRMLAPNQRGYSPGARPSRRRDYTLERTSSDVLALADAAGVDRFHVVGHDWGGGVAWALGARHPDRLLSMTSLSTPHPRAMQKAMLRNGQLLRSWYMVLFQLPKVPELLVGSNAFGRRFADAFADSGLDREEAERSVALLRDGAAFGAFGWYRALPFDDRSAPSRVSVPTLYVWSDRDIALGRAAAENSSEYVTGPYRFEELTGVSHWIPEEAPDTVIPMLIEQFRANPDSPAD